ncbi:MAG: UbiX family flavin prenyltransferase [Thermoplasmatales archaeon]|jgi:4-hydroxy-3-polyprenylbenzoate decarboxylase|nr:UbiX family flavin prenyltransferase [Candidatus Thermoplasmatota archaeon]MDA8055833.1 UbiX family flavin prenyltransferase [Thermoplasmatales archaeon]
MEYILAMTGASGIAYGVDILKKLPSRKVLILSNGAMEVARYELKGKISEKTLRGYADESYGEGDFGSPVASGSHKFDAFMIVPASMNTIGKIAAGVSDNLVTRVASIALKERRKLVIVFREMPLSTIHLRNLLTLSEAGAYILPASPGFYHGPSGLDDLFSFVTSRVFDIIGVDNKFIKRWGD